MTVTRKEPPTIFSEDAAWVAAALDGEGSILLRPPTRSGRRYAQVMCYNTSMAFVQKFAELTGAKVYKTSQGSRFGKLPVYKAIVQNRRGAIDLLSSIESRLIIKREKAHEVLDYYATHPPFAESSGKMPQKPAAVLLVGSGRSPR